MLDLKSVLRALTASSRQCLLPCSRNNLESCLPRRSCRTRSFILAVHRPNGGHISPPHRLPAENSNRDSIPRIPILGTCSCYLGYLWTVASFSPLPVGLKQRGQCWLPHSKLRKMTSIGQASSQSVIRMQAANRWRTWHSCISAALSSGLSPHLRFRTFVSFT